MAVPAAAADFPPPRAKNLRDVQAISRYLHLNGEAGPAAGERFALVGVSVSQQSGKLQGKFEQIQVSRPGKTTLIRDTTLSAPLQSDASFSNNPMGSILAALVEEGEIRVKKIETQSVSSGLLDESTEVKDVVVRLSGGAMVCSLKYGFIRARVSGTIAYAPQARTLVITLTSVSAGVPIGLDRVFDGLEDSLDFDWSVVERPRITIGFDEMFR